MDATSKQAGCSVSWPTTHVITVARFVPLNYPCKPLALGWNQAMGTPPRCALSTLRSNSSRAGGRDALPAWFTT
jgi:hypothetical protein